MALQDTRLQILELLAIIKTNLVPVPTPSATEPMTDKPIQGVTLANIDNLSAMRRPASVVEEPTISITC